MTKKMTQNSSNHKFAIYRSMVLLVLGIPMMCIGVFSKENTVCLVISAVYVLLLLINGNVI